MESPVNWTGDSMSGDCADNGEKTMSEARVFTLGLTGKYGTRVITEKIAGGYGWPLAEVPLPPGLHIEDRRKRRDETAQLIVDAMNAAKLPVPA